MSEAFMKERPVLPLLLSMSLPMVLSMLVNALYNIVDSFFVAQISEEAMTALSLVFPLQNLITAVGVGFGIGINAVIAYQLGADAREQADRAASLGLALALLHGIVLTVICACVLPAFLALFTDDAATQALGARYGWVVFAFTIVNTAGMAYEKIFQAVGRMKVTMISLASYSQVYVLVLGIYYKLQTFLYLTANGIIQGMRPLIGYNYGAGEQARVRQIFTDVLVMSAGIMVLGTIICLAAPAPIMALFTHTPATIAAGAEALRIIAGGFIVSAVSVTCSGALEGLGKGLPSLIISLCRYLLVILPAAFILSRFLGPTGVWHAFWLTEAVSALVSLLVYRRALRH